MTETETQDTTTAAAPEMWIHDATPGMEIVYRLPLEGWPRAVFKAGFGFENARLTVDGQRVLLTATKDDLESGVEGDLRSGDSVAMQLTENGLVVAVNGKRAVREDRIFAKPTRSAWIHAVIALAASAAGFTASAFYLVRSTALANLDPLSSVWAHKMGIHTLGWHLLLTLTLFPASVWGQRWGIRSVQVVSLVFFFIHVGIAAANADMSDTAIAIFNALSGLFFAISVVYGQRAYKDMDPIRALRENRF
ncbi:MAG: hypothetical protein U0441_33965 [Polyangiaceae bacterium]